MDFQSYLKKQSKKITGALESYLPRETEHLSRLHQAMRYAVLGAGKRVRPVLALAACEAVGGNEKKVIPAACAIELIHSYSLVHDDLPCMDDDDTRRGRPSCHKKYNAETALLVGDALLTLAFKVLSTPNGQNSSRDLERRLGAARFIAEAAGTYGMVGGQALDLEYKGKEPDLTILEFINTHKSGALIAASVRVGGYLGGGNKQEVESLYRYGKFAGLIFQIVDDILDREGYARLVGIPQAKREAHDLASKAKAEVRVFGGKARRLVEVVDFFLVRTS